ncbi:MAG: hypothetical protein R3F12_00045 [Lysobacteraceae bacterium]
MSKTVRIPDEIHELVKAEAGLKGRTIAEQLAHWIKHGLIAEAAEGDRSGLDAAIALSHKLDALDVASGKRSPESMLLISRERARQSKATFPAKYRSR